MNRLLGSCGNLSSCVRSLRIGGALLLAACAVNTRAQLAEKGELLLQEDFQRYEAFTKARQPVKDGWTMHVAHAEWRRTAEGVESLWQSGHNPVLVYEGDFGDVIVEVDFRYKAEPGKWAACRICAQNATMDPRAYAISIWANQDNMARARGFVMERDQWSGPITRVGYDESAEFLPDTWYTVRLEIVGNRAYATCGGSVIKGTHPMFGIPKKSLWLGTGMSRHEFRNLRVYAARPLAAPAEVQVKP